MGLLQGEKFYQDPSNTEPLVHPNKANSCRWSSQYSLQNSCKKKTDVNCQHVCLLQRVSPHAATVKNKNISVGFGRDAQAFVMSSYHPGGHFRSGGRRQQQQQQQHRLQYLLPICGRKIKSLSFRWVYAPFTNLQPLPSKTPPNGLVWAFYHRKFERCLGFFVISRASAVWVPATNNTHRYNKTKHLQSVTVRTQSKKNKKNKWCLLKTKGTSCHFFREGGTDEWRHFSPPSRCWHSSQIQLSSNRW